MPPPLLHPGSFPPDLPDRDFIDLLRSCLVSAHDAMRGRRVARDGVAACRELSDTMDAVVRALHDRARRNFLATAPDINYRLSVIAVGGYGRRELCPKSDVDLLFLYPYKVDRYVEAMTEWMLYPLWDLGLDVGYSVRNVRETIKMAGTDTSIRTALLDYRFVAGHEDFFHDSEKELEKFLFYHEADRFIEAKIREMRDRHEKTGSTVFVLEPNLKEGRGALRDLQTAIWTARIKYKCRTLTDLRNKGVVGSLTIRAVQHAMDYLLRVRNDLHFLANKKTDTLTFDLQERMAERFGYRDRGKDFGVERFMRAYYMNGVAVETLSEEILEQVGRFLPDTLLRPFSYLRRKTIGTGTILYKGKVGVKDTASLQKDPVRILEFFRSMQKTRAVMSARAKQQVQRALPAVGPSFREDPRAAKLFLEILADPEHLRPTLLAMNASRFLGRYIPEFSTIYCKVQRDVYHVYTVDVHSIRAASQFARIAASASPTKEEEEFLRLFRSVPKPEILTLAILCHDIGKGKGHGHSRIGAEIVARIGRQLGLPDPDVEDLVFLVENHLLMAHISQRRDLHDIEMILSFTNTVGTMARLDALYLLTYADIRSVGPEVWNQWKSMLLSELYDKAKNVLQHGVHKSPFEERAEQRREEVREMLSGHPAEGVERFVRRFDDRYYLATPDARFPEHFRLLSGYGGEPLVEVLDSPGSGTSEIVVLCPDQLGLFAKIAGTLSANGVNILNASIATSGDGVALDTFYVSYMGESLQGSAKKQRLTEDLAAVLTGRTTVESLIADRPAARYVRDKVAHYRPTRVVFDNTVSTRHTVVDIFTYDRIGLLFDITRTLTSLGIDIVLSKISTKADQVADVFYLSDRDGGKILDPDRQEEVRRCLMEAIQQ